MRRTQHHLVIMAASLAALCCPIAAQGTFKNGWHEDTKYGFRMKIPDK